VHPEDPRYKHLIGKELLHPFIPDRVLTVIADPVLVDMTFGTGAVKVTPAHDYNDFKCGERNNLEKINIFTEDGKINENGGKFEGLMRFDCRVAIEKELTSLGLYLGKEKNPMSLGFCSRSQDVIEPYLKP
jgi:valyl-tRNA synthetase